MMPVEMIIQEVEKICKKHGIEHLILIGSFATGVATKTSDVDFALKGGKVTMELLDEVSNIQTLRKIDIVEYDSCKNSLLLEDIDKYGKQIY